MNLDRRHFLKRSGAAAFAAGAGGLGMSSEARAARHGRSEANPLEQDGAPLLPTVADPAATLPAVPFHGEHQAGIAHGLHPGGDAVVNEFIQAA